MHHRLFVTTTADPEAGSGPVRESVYGTLAADPSFVDRGGRFHPPLADWFVIGGRWSGCLAAALMGPGYREQLLAELPGMGDRFIAARYVRANAESLCRIWAAHGGTGPHPLVRDRYRPLGADDDARPLTRRLFDAALAPYAGESAWFGELGGLAYADLEGEPLTPEAIGRTWLVVVDYHN